MENILIIFNYNDNNVIHYTNNLINKFNKYNFNVFVTDKYKSYITECECNFISCVNNVNVDVIITVGGDGTLMHASKLASRCNIPIIGINVGRLGFLATINKNDFSKLLDILDGNYIISKRMLLEVNIISNEKKVSYEALNDIVISKGNISKIIDLDVFYNEEPFSSYRCDGLIFSTPTGSTAYSLSAGGPVISPNINCFSITPICSHSIFNTPVVFDENTVLNVNINKNNKNDVYITIDGEISQLVDNNTKISIKMSDNFLSLLYDRSYNYYTILRNKFIDKGFYL